MTLVVLSLGCAKRAEFDSIKKEFADLQMQCARNNDSVEAAKMEIELLKQDLRKKASVITFLEAKDDGFESRLSEQTRDSGEIDLKIVDLDTKIGLKADADQELQDYRQLLRRIVMIEDKIKIQN